MRFKFDLLALIIGSGAISAIGAIAWRHNRHSRSVRMFFIATLAYALWLINNYLQLQNYSLSVTDFMVRLSYIDGLWLLVATWYFCISFPIERPPSWRARLTAILLVIGGSFLGMSPLVVSSISQEPGKVIIYPGPAYWLFGALLAFPIVASMIYLRRNYRVSNRLQRNQIRYVAFGILMCTSISLIFDIGLVLLNPLFGQSLVNLSVTLLTVMFLGYGFIRHRYIDIHRVVAWIFTYMICLVIVAGLVIGAKYGAKQINPNSAALETAAVVSVATLAVFVLPPISKFIKKKADQLFNVGWYDSQALLNSLGTMLAGEMYVDPLLRNVLDSICSELQVVAGELILVNGEADRHSVRYGEWSDGDHNVDLSHVPNTGQITIVDEMSADDPAAENLSKQGIRVCLPLLTRGRIVGYLLLGIKGSGDIFSGQDIDLLKILGNQLPVAILSVQAFEQINRFNSRLQQEVADATADLREAHQKLQLDDQMKTEFIILTSHNLRTPISIIKGYMSMLTEGKLTAAQRKLIEQMGAGVDRLSQLTENLLDIDSIISGNPLKLQPIKAEDVIVPLIKETSDQAKAKKLKFNTDISLENIVIKADVDRLSGAIGNLLSNACKFTDKGSVTLTAKQINSDLVVTVTDTGIGIAKKELPNLFSKFHRATDTLTYNYEGVGIGLYLTNLIIKEHGGSIKVTSELNKGSTFTVTLPIDNSK